ncbi:MAG: MOSC domain-containing protein, partial [Gammaproteobacteria bacterium]|nr:MOSC domain-containing protein [Gammaproteobacteria bacterium]
MIRLSRIFIYPIKSTAPLELTEAEVQAEGLAHDRRYVVTDEKGRFFTARRFPRMVLIRCELRDGGLRVTAPDYAGLDLQPAIF